MLGVITNWDILAHPAVTIQCFGWRVFFVALFSGQKESFLSVLQKTNIFGCSTREITDLLARTMELELRAKRIYEDFAKKFAQSKSAKRFFEMLSSQEQYHADLLELCRIATVRGGWNVSYLNPWQSYLPRLEQKMQEAEAEARYISFLDDALRLVVQIESAEINQVFQSILSASNSVFVKKTAKFRNAIETHISDICRMLPYLAPELTQVSKELREKFSRVA
jgi:rubrerythrin